MSVSTLWLRSQIDLYTRLLIRKNAILPAVLHVINEIFCQPYSFIQASPSIRDLVTIAYVELRRLHNLQKSLSCFYICSVASKPFGRFFQILWPSKNTLTLLYPISSQWKKYLTWIRSRIVIVMVIVVVIEVILKVIFLRNGTNTG